MFSRFFGKNIPVAVIFHVWYLVVYSRGVFRNTPLVYSHCFNLNHCFKNKLYFFFAWSYVIGTMAKQKYSLKQQELTLNNLFYVKKKLDGTWYFVNIVYPYSLLCNFGFTQLKNQYHVYFSYSFKSSFYLHLCKTCISIPHWPGSNFQCGTYCLFVFLWGVTPPPVPVKSFCFIHSCKKIGLVSTSHS